MYGFDVMCTLFGTNFIDFYETYTLYYFQRLPYHVAHTLYRPIVETTSPVIGIDSIDPRVIGQNYTKYQHKDVYHCCIKHATPMHNGWTPGHSIRVMRFIFRKKNLKYV